MPDRSSRETLARQWQLLRLLPNYSSWATASELTAKLAGDGYTTSKRTVERDLADLSQVFPIERNDKGRPYGWRWRRGVELRVPGVELAEALSLTLVEQFLARMLPLSLWRSFQPRLDHAREKLEALGERNKTARWVEKIHYVSPTLPLIPPKIDEDVLECVQRALIEDRQLDAEYRSAGTDEAKPVKLNPLGLIQRGPVTYLVATAYNYDDIRYYALHRIQSVVIGIDDALHPENFSLTEHLAAGHGHFVPFDSEGEIQLEARVLPDLAQILEETPLSEDMECSGDPEMPTVTATVPDTWQLRWWILSQGARIEVIRPLSLREEMTHEVRHMAALYN